MLLVKYTFFVKQLLGCKSDGKDCSQLSQIMQVCMVRAGGQMEHFIARKFHMHINSMISF